MDAVALRALEMHLSTFGGKATPVLNSKSIPICRKLLQYIATVKVSMQHKGQLWLCRFIKAALKAGPMTNWVLSHSTLNGRLRRWRILEILEPLKPAFKP